MADTRFAPLADLRLPAYRQPRIIAKDHRIASALLQTPTEIPADERDEIIARLDVQRRGDRMPTTTDRAGRVVVMCLGCGAAFYQNGAHPPIVVCWQRKLTKDIIIGETVRERWHIPALAADGSHNVTPITEEIEITFTSSREALCCPTCIGKYPSKKYIVPSRRVTPSMRYMPVFDAKGRPALFVTMPAWGK